MFGLGERTEGEIIDELTNDHNEQGGTDVATKKPSAIVKKQVLHTVKPSEGTKVTIKRKVGAKTPATVTGGSKKKIIKAPKSSGAIKRKAGETKVRAPRAGVKRTPEVEARNADAARLAIGQEYTYTGRDEDLAGKKVLVLEYLRGDGRLRVQRGTAKITCSPYALGIAKPEGAKKPKWTKTKSKS